MENYRFELKNAANTVEMALSSSKMMPAFFYTAHCFSTASSKVALEGPGSRNGGFLELGQFFDMFLTCKKGEYWVNMGFLFCLTILFDKSRGDSRSLFRACSVAKLVCMCVLLFLYLFYVCVIWSTCNSAETCGD